MSITPRTSLKTGMALTAALLLAGVSGCAVYPGAGAVQASVGVGSAGHGAGISYQVPLRWSAPAAPLPVAMPNQPAAEGYPAYAGATAYPDDSPWPVVQPHTPNAVWVGAGNKQAQSLSMHMPSSTQGLVVDIRPITYRANPQAGAAVGTVAGGVLGGVLANHNSHRYDRGGNTVAGVLVGALLGSALGTASSYATQTVAYRVTARMDSGAVRSIDYAQPPSVRIGERVAYDGQQFLR